MIMKRLLVSLGLRNEEYFGGICKYQATERSSDTKIFCCYNISVLLHHIYFTCYRTQVFACHCRSFVC